MAHLIDKSVLVTEINRKRNYEVQWMKRQGYTDYNMGLRDGYVDILSYIESLEVKEVDLKKEIQSWVEDNSVNGYYQEDVYETAKHFFELGLKAQKGI